MKKIIVIIIFEAIIISGLVMIMILQLIQFSISNREIYIDCQNNSVNYNSYDPYCLIIREKVMILNSQKEIWITKSMDHNYGYVINYPENYYAFDEKVKADIATDWSNDGVTIDIYDLKIYVPKEKFIGGR